MENRLLRKARELLIESGLPSWAIESGYQFDSPIDIKILAKISELARESGGQADVSIITFAGSIDVAPFFVQHRLIVLIADGCILCDARVPGQGGTPGRYLLRVATRAPAGWGTDPPHKSA
ncbi:MAG: hypothetical protein RIF32_11065 [Leptospirales bacterium]